MDIETEIRDGVLRVAFNRPGKKNAITAAMYRMLTDAFESAQEDSSVRVVLIAGSAEIFTAGNDIADFIANSGAVDSAPALPFLSQISRAEKPIVAAVRGQAVGIGTTLLLHCDLVYAADNARFSMPFTQLGLCPEAASSMLLPQIAGYQRAAEKLLLGESFDAHEAHAMGLVNKVLTADEVLAYAERQAARLAELPRSSLRITKRLMKSDMAGAIDTRMALEIAEFVKLLSSPEAREAFAAFMQKRKPDFRQFG